MSHNKWKKVFLGMPNSKKYWMAFRYSSQLFPQIELYFNYWLDHKKNDYFIEQMEDFINRTRELRFQMNDTLTIEDFVRAKEALEKANSVPTAFITDWAGLSYAQPCFSLGNCTAATPDKAYQPCTAPKQKQGNNPMRYETTTANAVITAAKSDEAIQREYLIERLTSLTCNWRNPKYQELRELFNLDADNTPKTAKQLLEVIQGGKFKVDEKKIAKAEAYANGEDYDDDCDCEYPGGVFYGITFDGPVADRKGYEQAVKDYEKACQDTRDTIMIAAPADGLAALKALEAWQPQGKAN